MSNKLLSEHAPKKQHGCISCCTVCVVTALLVVYSIGTVVTTVSGGGKDA